MTHQTDSIEQIMKRFLKNNHILKNRELFPLDSIGGEEDALDCLKNAVSLQKDGGEVLSYYFLVSLFRVAVALGVCKAFQSGIPVQKQKDFFFREFSAPDRTIEKFDESSRDEKKYVTLENWLALEMFFAFEDWMLENQKELKNGEIDFEKSLIEALTYSYRIGYTVILENV